MPRRFSSFLILPLAVQTLWGQQAKSKDVSLEELEALLNTPISVSSTKAESIFTTPSTVSVVDGATIARYNCQTVADILDLVPGMHMLRTYFKRDIPTARGILQEQYATKVLLLVDGVPTWMASTGEGSPYRINPNEIERVEVLRGPASVLYGSNAYVGAVNLVLKKAEVREGEAHLGVGSKGTRLGGARYALTQGGFGVMASVNLADIEGATLPYTDEAGVTKPLHDYERARNATVGLRMGSFRILYNLYQADEGYYGNDPRWSTGAGNNHYAFGRLLNYTYEGALMEGVDLKAGGTYDWNFRDFSRKDDDSQRARVEGFRITHFLKLNVKLGPAFSLEAGGDWDARKSVEYARYNPITGVVDWHFGLKDRSVTERSYFMQGKLDFKTTHLLAGSRYTRNELAGGNVSHRLTVVQQFGPRNSLKLIAGQSYRAPTLFELYFQSTPVNPTVLGNPDLKPEKADTLELAWVNGGGGRFVQALLYTSVYKDKIFRVPVNPANPTGPVRYRNGDIFRATGLEVEARYANPSLVDMMVAVDYLLKTDKGDEDAVANPNHYNFKYVPRLNANLGLSRNFGDFFASVQGRYRSSAQGPLRTIGGQSTWDLNLGYSHALGPLLLTHVASVKNATDEDLRIPEYVRHNLNDVPLTGMDRRYTYTVRANF